MKTKKMLALLGIPALLLLSSCATKQNAVTQLRAFQQEIEVNGAMYDLNDWKKAATKYAKINKKIYKHYNEYSAQELEEVGRINGQCVASFAKGTAQNIAGKAQGAVGIIKGIVDGVKEGIGR